MKLLLVFAFSVLSVIVFGQTDQNNSLDQSDLLKKFKIDGVSSDSLTQLFQNYLRKQEYKIELSNGNKVVILPQDNMPCIVPDSTNAAKIPNAWGNVKTPFISPYHPIPNPGLPLNSFQYRRSDSWVKPVPKKK